MAENERVFSEDLIGCKIVGYIPREECKILLLDNGRTIEISTEHMGDIGDIPGAYWVSVGTWKPPETTGNNRDISTQRNL